MVHRHECGAPQKSTVIKVRLFRSVKLKGLGVGRSENKVKVEHPGENLGGDNAKRTHCREKRLLVTSVESFT